MKPVFKSLIAAATVAVMSSTAVQAQEPASLEDLLNSVKSSLHLSKKSMHNAKLNSHLHVPTSKHCCAKLKLT